MKPVRRFINWMDRQHDLPRIGTFVCLLCGAEERKLVHRENSVRGYQRPYCKCGNYMTLRD